MGYNLTDWPSPIYGAPSVSKLLKIPILITAHLVNVAILEYANAATDMYINTAMDT